jgi:hypothetical protein
MVAAPVTIRGALAAENAGNAAATTKSGRGATGYTNRSRADRSGSTTQQGRARARRPTAALLEIAAKMQAPSLPAAPLEALARGRAVDSNASALSVEHSAGDVLIASSPAGRATAMRGCPGCVGADPAGAAGANTPSGDSFAKAPRGWAGAPENRASPPSIPSPRTKSGRIPLEISAPSRGSRAGSTLGPISCPLVSPGAGSGRGCRPRCPSIPDSLARSAPHPFHVRRPRCPL